jgi:hypothetical protein
MKTFVLTVSRVFPATHKRKGEPTLFQSYILNTLINDPVHQKKSHTIRANYELWAKRIKEVQEGKAILSIRYWSGKPYNSKQVEICQLDKDSGIGVQELSFIENDIQRPGIWGEKYVVLAKISEVAKNDGLSLDDFKDWFRKYDLSKPMAIIHLTKFRY